MPVLRALAPGLCFRLIISEIRFGGGEWAAWNVGGRAQEREHSVAMLPQDDDPHRVIECSD